MEQPPITGAQTCVPSPTYKTPYLLVLLSVWQRDMGICGYSLMARHGTNVSNCLACSKNLVVHNERECICHLSGFGQSRLSTNLSGKVLTTNSFFSPNIHARYARWATLCLHLFPLTVFPGATFAWSGWTKQGATACCMFISHVGILCMHVGMLCVNIGILWMHVSMLCLHNYILCMHNGILHVHVGILQIHADIGHVVHAWWYIVLTRWHVVHERWHIVCECWHVVQEHWLLYMHVGYCACCKLAWSVQWML